MNRRRGFTLIELLVVIAIIVFADGHAKYKQVSNLRSRDFGLVPDDGVEADANKKYTAAF